MYPEARLPVNPSDDSLTAALARHQIELPPRQVALLERYCGLLWEWNDKLNLTRHTDYEKFVGRDLVDSLAFSHFLAAGERVLDVGTGGGVPGVVLAILRDDLTWPSASRWGRRPVPSPTSSPGWACAAPVHHARAEDLSGREHFQTLVIRAVARLKKLLQWFQPHWGAFRAAVDFERVRRGSRSGARPGITG